MHSRIRVVLTAALLMLASVVPAGAAEDVDPAGETTGPDTADSAR